LVGNVGSAGSVGVNNWSPCVTTNGVAGLAVGAQGDRPSEDLVAVSVCPLQQCEGFIRRLETGRAIVGVTRADGVRTDRGRGTEQVNLEGFCPLDLAAFKLLLQ
jgi:hypothetical protein